MQKIKETLKILLQSWKDKRFPEIIEREINLSAYIALKMKKIIAVTGFRRVGKTYLLLGLIEKMLKSKDREQIVYINFEDERIPPKVEFLTELIPTIRQTYSKRPEFIFLDEVQNMPQWSKWIRRVYDTEELNIFVTGSSSELSSREIPTELRGRALEVRVFPLSFREFLKFKNVEFNLKILRYSESEKLKLVKLLNEYLNYGSLPEVVLSSEDKKIELIQNYYNTVLSRDVIERFRVKNEEGLRALVRLLLNSTEYSVTKLYNTLKSMNYEIGKTALQRYISYVESSYFLSSIPIFSYKIKEQLKYPRKAYFIDNGFINALSTKFSKNSGRLHENCISVELLRRHGKENLYYWKNPQHEEVDFVIKQGLKVKQLIQACYDIDDLDIKKRELRALLKASKELKCANLLIITDDYEAEEKVKGKKVKFIPLWKWLLQ